MLNVLFTEWILPKVCINTIFLLSRNKLNEM